MLTDNVRHANALVVRMLTLKLEKKARISEQGSVEQGAQSIGVPLSMPRITSIKVRRRLVMMRSFASSCSAGDSQAASAASMTAQLSSSLSAAARSKAERSAGGLMFWLLVISQCSSLTSGRFRYAL